MSESIKIGIFIVQILLTRAIAQPQFPAIQLHPDNPHYFLFRGNPTLLITSGEHYGAVLNGNFNYTLYLETLAADRLNYTRIFSGVYAETPGAFGITQNTLAPAGADFLSPWARSSKPGYINGGNLFDLNVWDERYFERLKYFVRKASTLGIVVEVTFFCSLYGNYNNSPLYFKNNVNGLDSVGQRYFNTLHNGMTKDYMEKLVRRVVRELNAFDNVIYEIFNEPWSDHGVVQVPINPNLPEWQVEWKNRVELANEDILAFQDYMAKALHEEESRLLQYHLIAQNYCNFGFPVPDVKKEISILNFHYANPEAALLNYGWNKALGFDESGFAGSEDATYRKQAWTFILSGGSIFNNLDYSFFVGGENGTGTNKAPGGGSVALRKQLGVLRSFMERFDFIRMSPNEHVVVHAPGVFTRSLANKQRNEVAVYITHGNQCTISLNIPKGTYKVEWISPLDGSSLGQDLLIHKGGIARLNSPLYSEDLALLVQRR